MKTVNNYIKSRYTVIAVLVLTIFGTLVTACKKEGEGEDPTSTGYMQMEMTDAPGDYLHVYVEVKNVQVHQAGGWTNLATRDTIYDLLTLQNDITTVLADSTVLPSGAITQLRLILGNNNSVVLTDDSSGHELIIPSSLQTGIKINLNTSIEPDKTTRVVIDFDAAQSINIQGNGSYQMSPVIKVKSIEVR